MERKVKILMVCHGNICRSPLAQSVMTYLVKERNLSDRFQIESAATSREEIGNSPHSGTVRKLREEGIPFIPHRAVQMTRADYETYDYLIGMDDWSGLPEGIRRTRFISFWNLRGKQGTLRIPGIPAILMQHMRM